MTSVASWAHRALRGIPRYHHCRDEPDYCRRFAFLAGEDVVGVYENPATVKPSAIVITNTGLYWQDAAATRSLEFAHMRSVRGPDEKATGAEIRVGLVDGSSRTIRIEGGDGKYRDVYSMVRFLARAKELMQKEP